jgi:DNA-binding transcriptional LysR family regulator
MHRINALRPIRIETWADCEAADPAAALGLVAAGLGLAFVQKSLAPTAGAAVVLRELPEAFTLRVRIHCVHPGSPSPLAHRLMMAS